MTTTPGGSTQTHQTAYLDVRALPWRLRARVMKADTLRDFDPISSSSDISGLVIGLVAWVVIYITAPILVLVLAAALLSIELPVVIAVAVLLAVARFSGLIPWSVVILDPHTGTETHERHRNLLRAVARIRDINHDQHVDVRWAWA